MAGHIRPLFVLFGASMTQYSFEEGGWGAALADIYSRKADLLLRGFSGWNTRRAVQVLEKFFPKDTPKQPDLVTVFFGANDAAVPVPTGRGQAVPIPEFKDNLRRIATYLKALSETTRVILITAPPIDEEGRREDARLLFGERKAGEYLDRTNERAGQYAAACVSVAEELNVGVVDLWTSIQRHPNWQKQCLTDGMHLSSAGSKIMLEELLKVLQRPDWKPSLHYEHLPKDFQEPNIYDYVHPYEEVMLDTHRK